MSDVIMDADELSDLVIQIVELYAPDLAKTERVKLHAAICRAILHAQSDAAKAAIREYARRVNI